MTNNNPRAYDAKAEWIECPHCHNVTLPLADYQISNASESPDVSASGLEFLLFGWWAFALNFLADVFSLGGRKTKLAHLKAEILPQFPRSLVCPRCLNVIKRA